MTVGRSARSFGHFEPYLEKGFNQARRVGVLQLKDYYVGLAPGVKGLIGVSVWGQQNVVE